MISAAGVFASCEEAPSPAGSGGSPSTSSAGGTLGSGGTTDGGGGASASGGEGGGGGGQLPALINCDPPTGTAAQLHLEPVADGFIEPMFLTHARGDADRLYVVERRGVIQLVKNGVTTVFLDMQARVMSSTDERGALGLAFHPDYQDNGRFFVHYSNGVSPAPGMGDTVIEEYRRNPANADQADPTPVRLTISASQPGASHKGGTIAFGADGFLYIALGDGGESYDNYGNAQNKNSLLGKLLRIDIDGGVPYAIPSGNITDGLPEIYDIGLRNPYRWSFDACTGDRYIADVGQECYEEIDIASATSGNKNWGWPIREAAHCVDQDQSNGNDCSLTSCAGHDAPSVELTRSSSTCVIGGHVYRGTLIPWLRGAYVYGDFSARRAWYLRWSAGAITEGPVEISDQIGGVAMSAIGADAMGELYMVGYDGAIYRIEP